MTNVRLLSAACALALMAGCTMTQQAREVQPSGFLGGDYSRLQEGRDGEALLVYHNANANLAAYDKIKLDPVEIWADDDSAFKDVSQADRQALADHFYSVIHQELAQDYEMVDTLGPGVLHVEVALTDAEASNPTMDTISTVVPIGLAVSQTMLIATGKPTFVGEASAEARVTDGASGELLAAAVDRRVGSKALGGAPTDSWGDVEQSFAYWAQQLRYRLCTERGDTDCQPPAA